MHYIYSYENQTNHKRYIGQTNNIQKRKIGHRSAAYNINSNDYHSVFHAAFRKYGEQNFTFTIIEEINDEFGQDYIDEREIFFIDYYNSQVPNGYNITSGGHNYVKTPLTFSEKCALSHIFNEQQVRDIQQMLLDGYASFEVLKKYPMLTRSFLDNINSGLNFKREDLTYPLLTSASKKYTKETQEAIIADIKANVSYNQIKQKYDISLGMISAINNGRQWVKDNEVYPLCYKKCKDDNWGRTIIAEIITTNTPIAQLAKKYNRSSDCIDAINSGRNRKDPRFRYPLRANKDYNIQILSKIYQ